MNVYTQLNKMGIFWSKQPTPVKVQPQPSPKLLSSEKKGNPNLVTVRLSNRQIAEYELLPLLNSYSFPEHDAHGKIVIPQGPDMFTSHVPITEKFKSKVIKSYRHTLKKQIVAIKDALVERNANTLVLIDRHSTYVNKLTLGEIAPLVAYINGVWMEGKYTKNEFLLTAHKTNSFVVNLPPKTLQALKDEGLPITTGTGRGQELIRRLNYVIRRAPTVNGEFTLWRKASNARVSRVRTGSYLPHPSFVSTTMLLPFALGWNANDCCLFRIQVRFNQVPGLAIMDIMQEVTSIGNEFEVLLAPCYLRVDKRETVVLDELMTPQEKVVRNVWKKYSAPLSNTVTMLTCTAVPGRIEYTKKGVKITRN